MPEVLNQFLKAKIEIKDFESYKNLAMLFLENEKKNKIF